MQARHTSHHDRSGSEIDSTFSRLELRVYHLNDKGGFHQTLSQTLEAEDKTFHQRGA